MLQKKGKNCGKDCKRDAMVAAIEIMATTLERSKKCLEIYNVL